MGASGRTANRDRSTAAPCCSVRIPAFTDRLQNLFRYTQNHRYITLLLQMAGHGGTVSRRTYTANQKLTKLYWLSRKRSRKQLAVYTFRAKKAEGHDNIFSGATCRSRAPSNTLSNSFRRYCSAVCIVYVYG